jgi:RNA polymerase sigma-70 factor, ECF subfamily
MSDEQLVVLTQAGDLHAFNQLIARRQAEIYRFLRRLLGNHEDALDLCQETLVRAYLKIGTLRQGSRFRDWVYQIALNLSRDRYRSAAGRVRAQPIEDEGPEGVRLAVSNHRALGLDQEMAQRGFMGVLDDVLRGLPDDQRDALLLREYHGFSTEEIAGITGVPAGTVRSRIFYGLRTVRRSLGQRGYTGTGQRGD